MHSEDTLLRLIERIYDAALAPELWPEFLKAFADAIDGHNISFTFADMSRKHNSIVDLTLTDRWDPEGFREYNDHYFALDPWSKLGMERGLFRTGVVALGNSVLSTTDFQRTEFFNDFGKQYGVANGVTAVIRAESTGFACLNACQRGTREFGEPELLLVQRLLPHIQRSLQLLERLSAVSAARSASEEVIDRMPFGVVLVDAAGRAVFVNTAAQQILDTRDGLMLREKSLVTTTLPQTTEVRTLIAGAIAASRGEPLLGSGGALTIGRPSLKRPLQVLVTPLRAVRTSLASSSSAGCAAVFISDPELQTLTDAAMLQQFFGFTPAETRFATQLLEHKSVDEAADFLEVSLNTARSHIKKLFEKTGTRRQSELLRLLGGGVGQLRR